MLTLLFCGIVATCCLVWVFGVVLVWVFVLVCFGCFICCLWLELRVWFWCFGFEIWLMFELCYFVVDWLINLFRCLRIIVEFNSGCLLEFECFCLFVFFGFGGWCCVWIWFAILFDGCYLFICLCFDCLCYCYVICLFK